MAIKREGLMSGTRHFSAIRRIVFTSSALRKHLPITDYYVHWCHLSTYFTLVRHNGVWLPPSSPSVAIDNFKQASCGNININANPRRLQINILEGSMDHATPLNAQFPRMHSSSIKRRARMQFQTWIGFSVVRNWFNLLWWQSLSAAHTFDERPFTFGASSYNNNKCIYIIYAIGSGNTLCTCHMIFVLNHWKAFPERGNMVFHPEIQNIITEMKYFQIMIFY